MITLPNGCSCSELRVSPKSWRKIGANTKKDWFIYYRFYDPSIVNTAGKVKPMLIIVKAGMNAYKGVQERRSICESLLANEMELLTSKGYNPVSKKMFATTSQFFEVDPSTPFIVALQKGLAKVKGVKGTIDDMRSVVAGVKLSATQLGFAEIPISQVTRKYIKAILENCGKTRERWSAMRFNKYRAYLMKIFKELVEMEAIDYNPIHDITKQKETKKKREVLSLAQRIEINTMVRLSHYAFWRIIHIFFHSGSRETELFKVQAKHVDLVNQTCKYTVMKGTEIREVIRPIKDSVLHLWKEVMQQACDPEDFLVSEVMEPGPQQISPNNINRQWKKHVKDPLGITADFYCLKHMNTTEMIDALSSVKEASRVASGLNGHTTPVITISTYDTNKENRDNELIKAMKNTFAG